MNKAQDFAQQFLRERLDAEEMSLVKGNTPIHIKELPIKWLTIFRSRGNGFCNDIAERVAVKEVWLVPSADHPEKLEGKVVVEVEVTEGVEVDDFMGRFSDACSLNQICSTTTTYWTQGPCFFSLTSTYCVLFSARKALTSFQDAQHSRWSLPMPVRGATCHRESHALSMPCSTEPPHCASASFIIQADFLTTFYHSRRGSKLRITTHSLATGVHANSGRVEVREQAFVDAMRILTHG